MQLHREFQRAGADVLQALTFYASEDKLQNRGNYVAQKYSVSRPSNSSVNYSTVQYSTTRGLQMVSSSRNLPVSSYSCVQCAVLNAEACKLAHQVAAEAGQGTLVTASVSQTPAYLSGEGKTRVQQLFKTQVDAFRDSKVDFIICEVCLLCTATSLCSPLRA